jgi:hypothetical protein
MRGKQAVYSDEGTRVPKTSHSPLTESPTDVRIVGLNKDKTRKTNGSYTAYQVYFELSGAPPVIWRDAFGREWNDVDSVHDARIDGDFLVLRCPLQEIAGIHLPVLKKAVAATNKAYERYLQEQATEQDHAENDWMPALWIPQPGAIHRIEQDRKSIDDLAELLVF